jgi:steroid Delta-isomerase
MRTLKASCGGGIKLRPISRAFSASWIKNIAEWYRSRSFLSDGNLLTWEYPRKTPQGDQVDVVESMDIEDGLIAYHRVYWGSVGFKALLAAMNKST